MSSLPVLYCNHFLPLMSDPDFLFVCTPVWLVFDALIVSTCRPLPCVCIYSLCFSLVSLGFPCHVCHNDCVKCLGLPTRVNKYTRYFFHSNWRLRNSTDQWHIASVALREIYFQPKSWFKQVWGIMKFHAQTKPEVYLKWLAEIFSKGKRVCPQNMTLDFE